MSKQEPIHSGQFMTSNPHTNAPDFEDEDVEVDVVDVEEGSAAVPLDRSTAKEKLLKDVEKPVTFYKFGPQKTQSIAIDVSLNKLNRCIRVAYMKMTTPKWKDFKGLKLQWKSRIRLNNVIWRAYYLEFRKPGRKKKAPYCYFSVPDDDTTHTKMEGSILEGMYWKRRMEAVCAQYKRWRAYNSRKKRCCRKRENSCGCEMAPSMMMMGQNMAQKLPGQSQQNSQQIMMRSLTPENMISEEWNNGSLFDFDDDLDNEFTNQLFEQLNAPFLFPNPKEGGGVCLNADIMQPGLMGLQPSIEEIGIYTSLGAEDTTQLVDPIEFANSLPSTGGELSSQPTPQQQQQYSTPTQSAGKVMPQQYTAKEYDAANMLIDYSNRALHHQQHPHQQQQPQQSSAANQQHNRPSATKATAAAANAGQRATTVAMPVPAFTPSVANPLYSQAAVYEPQRLATIGQQQSSRAVQQQEANKFRANPSAAALDQLGGIYSALDSNLTTTRPIVAPPPAHLPMSTKIANQTMPTHQTITSVASSNPSQFFPSSIDYSLLVAASSGAIALSQVLPGQATMAGPSLSHQPQWPWFTQQQQQSANAATQQQQPMQQQLPIYPTNAQQLQHVNQLGGGGGKGSNGIQHSPVQQPAHSQISPIALSANNNFSTQSLLLNSPRSNAPSSLPYASPLINLVSPHQQQSNGNGGRAPSILTAHLQQNKAQVSQQQQQSPLLQSLAATASTGPANPQPTVGQFVMSDLSRYLTQQGPIGINTMLQQTAANPAALALNTSNIGGCLSPTIGVPHYSPATTPLSAPIIGAFNSHQQQKKSLQHQKQQQQHQVPQLNSQHSIDSTFSSPPPPKKASTSALPTYAEIQRQQQHLSPPKKGRASFSAAQRPANLAQKKQMQQQQIGAAAQQHQLEMGMMAADGQKMFTYNGAPQNNPPTPQLANTTPAATKASRRASSGRRQQSMESQQQQAAHLMTTSLTPPPPVQPLLAPQSLPRRKGQSVTGGMMSRNNEQKHRQQATSIVPSEENAITNDDDAASTTSIDMHHSEMKVKEESADEKAPASASSSHSAPADSTLHPEERKRILHLNAEKNRRSALKEGFECLVNAIPMVEQAGVKCTNAVVLNRAAQHIRGLQSKQEQQQVQIRAFREKITNMNERIALLQSNLPSSSTNNSRADNSSPSMRIQIEQFFERTKRDRSREDFRFWLMCEVLKPIVNSFAEQVHPNAADRERVMQSARKWADTHWNSAVLRPIASDTLVRVATSSGAFTNEKALSNYIAQQINQQEKHDTSKPHP